MCPANVYVTQIDTGEVVRAIEVKFPADSSQGERFLMGLLRNMDTDRFYVGHD